MIRASITVWLDWPGSLQGHTLQRRAARTPRHCYCVACSAAPPRHAHCVIVAPDRPRDVPSAPTARTACPCHCVACAAWPSQEPTLQRRLREQHAVVGHHADRAPEQTREAGDQRGPVQRLELVQAAAVQDARERGAHVPVLPRVRRHQTWYKVGRQQNAQCWNIPYQTPV